MQNRNLHYPTLRGPQAGDLLHIFPQGVKILDMDRLTKAAKFEDTYLQSTEVPRQTERLLDQITAVKRRFSPQYTQHGTSRI